MPSANTFSIPPIAEFVTRNLVGRRVIVDPYARDAKFGTITNDLNPDTSAQYHMRSVEFLEMLARDGVVADAVIYDPPYSPRQVSECYRSVGITPTMKDTQSAVMNAACRDVIRRIIADDGIVLTFGWSTVGMGAGFTIEEIRLVCHGGGHYDTICMMERRDNRQLSLL